MKIVYHLEKEICHCHDSNGRHSNKIVSINGIAYEAIDSMKRFNY